MRIILSLVSAFLLAACGGGGGGGPGDGPNGGLSGSAENVQGSYFGTSSDGRSLTAFVLSNGQFWVIDHRGQLGGMQNLAGFVAGTGNESGSRFTSTKATQVSFEQQKILPSLLSGDVPAKGRIDGTLQLDGQAPSFSLYRTPYPALVNAGGSYVALGISVVVNGQKQDFSGNFSIDGSGALSGTLSGNCTLAGSVLPRGDAALHDLTIRFSGNLCIVGGRSLQGIAYIEAVDFGGAGFTRQLSGFAKSSSDDAGLVTLAVGS